MQEVTRLIARSPLRCLAVLLLGAALVGCDGGESSTTSAPLPARPARDAAKTAETKSEASKAPIAVSAQSEITRQEFLPSARDPFTLPALRAANTGPNPNAAVQLDCDIRRDPLGTTLPEQLRLRGLITGTAEPRAMFSTSKTQDIIVGEGSRVGPQCKNVIESIRDNQVEIVQVTMVEEERVRTVIKLRNDETRAEFDD